MERERCPRHVDPTLCEALRRATEAEPSVRFVMAEEVAMAAWDLAADRLRKGWCDEFLELYDTCDCWKNGGSPFPSLARSALLYHWPLPEALGATAGGLLEDEALCPSWRAWLRAENTAVLSFFRVSGSTPSGLSLVEMTDRTVLRAESAPRRFDKGDLVFARSVRFAGADFLLESEDPLRGKAAAEAVRRLDRLDPGDPRRAGRLFDAWRAAEPVKAPPLPLMSPKSGPWRN